jgi:hypothetical protein
MKGKPEDRPRKAPGEAPRTDLPPTREPYDDGYFGTGEEEGVEREREAPPGGDRGRKDGR